MADVCPNCGLPKELCVCETIAKEIQKITVSAVKKKFNRIYTEVTGIDDKSIDLKELCKKLKNSLACGGTAKDGKIELQGNHTQKVRKALMEAGFNPDVIEVRESFLRSRGR